MTDADWIEGPTFKDRHNVLPTIPKAIQESKADNFQLNNGNNHIKFMKNIKYLGLIINLCLTEDTKNETRIEKSKSWIGILSHFFSNKDIELYVKYWV